MSSMFNIKRCVNIHQLAWSNYESPSVSLPLCFSPATHFLLGHVLSFFGGGGGRRKEKERDLNLKMWFILLVGTHFPSKLPATHQPTKNKLSPNLTKKKSRLPCRVPFGSGIRLGVRIRRVSAAFVGPTPWGPAALATLGDANSAVTWQR